METLYRKVAVSDRKPIKSGTYFSNEEEVYYRESTKKFEHNYDAHCVYPQWWLEEIPDTTAQLQADKAELLELRSTIEEFRGKANQSADNLHKRGLQSSGMCSQAMETAYNLCLIEIESLIQKHKQCQENKPR